MEKAIEEMIRNQVGKAEETLSAAKILIKSDFPDDAISRAYYAIFHAASAVLLAEGITVKSHAALKEMFGLHLVKKGKIEKKYSQILRKLKDDREDSDYDIYTDFSGHEAKIALHDAEQFIKAMKQYLTRSHRLKL